MPLYNLTNYSSSRSPTTWLKTTNVLSDGALGIGLPIVIFLVFFISFAARGLTKYAMVSSGFISFVCTLVLYLMGLTNSIMLYIFGLLTAIGVVILVFDKGY